MENIQASTFAPGNEVFERYKKKRWFLLLFGVIMMLSVSVGYAWTTLSGPISKAFGEIWSETKGGLVFTLFMYSYAIFGVVGGILVGKLKTVRINILIGAACLFLAFLLSSFAQNFTLLIIGYSIIGGMGTVLIYNAVIVNITKWFTDKLGLATGIILMGYGVGPLIIGTAYSGIVSAGIAWNTVFWVMGLVIACIMVIGAIVMVAPPKDYVAPVCPPKVDKFPIDTLELSPLQMIKRPSFWLLFVMGCCCTMPSMVVSSFGRQILENVDAAIKLNSVSIIIGAVSMANGCGRVITGIINDKFGIGFTIRVGSATVFLSVLLILGAILLQNLVVLIITLVFGGFCMGMAAPDGAIVTRKLFGEKHYQINIQVVMLAGFINSMGATMFGSLFDVSNGVIVPLCVLAGVALIGSIAAWSIKKP
ncbi:MAG: OFA family MFS transporter [Clostridiales bacterium]|nr:OFA family MFS transporter [Clostridiales bacterium]